MDKWYDSLSPESLEWMKMAVRNLSDPPVLTYLFRLHRSIHEIFAPWFCGKTETIFSHLPYTEILKQQHISLVIGKDGAPPYMGATCKEHGLNLNHIVPPGQFRHKIVPPNTWPHNMTFRFICKFPEDISPRLRNLIREYIDDSGSDKIIEPTEILPLDFKDGAHCSIDVIQLPRINCKISIWNKIYAHYITHHYPDHKDKEVILNTMSMIIEKIKQQYLRKEYQLDKVLLMLEEYLYIGIHSHPFESVNFSIVMAQFNYMLSRFGLQGTGPSNIDWVGISEQFPEFQISFRKKLAKNNPHIITLPIVTYRSPWISILAHISDDGDQYFQEGVLIEHIDSSIRKWIEGIMITTTLPDDVHLEYKGHVQYEGDTDWIPARIFMGSWGKSQALEGIMLRFVGTEAHNYNINYFARLGDSEWTSICKNGEFCGTRGQNKPITGLKIWITSKKLKIYNNSVNIHIF